MKTLQEIMDEQRMLTNNHKVSERSVKRQLLFEDEEWRKNVTEKMSESAKLREPNQTGLVRGTETREKLSRAKMSRSEEKRKEEARLGGLWHKGKPKPKYECPHCKRMIAANLFNRYHNDNCRSKP
jgi:hypothetical protein